MTQFFNYHFQTKLSYLQYGLVRVFACLLIYARLMQKFMLEPNGLAYHDDTQIAAEKKFKT